MRIVKGLIVWILILGFFAWAVGWVVTGTPMPWSVWERNKAAAERQARAEAIVIGACPGVTHGGLPVDLKEGESKEVSDGTYKCFGGVLDFTSEPAPAAAPAGQPTPALVQQEGTVVGKTEDGLIIVQMATPIPPAEGPAAVIESSSGEAVTGTVSSGDIFADEGQPEASLVVDGKNIPDNYVETGYAMPAVTYTATCTGVILIQGFSVVSEDLGLNGEGLFHIQNCPTTVFNVTVKDGSLLVRAEKSAICEMTAYQVLAADSREHLVGKSNMSEFCKPE